MKTMMKTLTLLLSAILCLTLLPAFAEGDVVVACVGDSLTFGMVPNTPGNQSERAYPTVLGELLGEGYDVRNFGIPGSALTENGVCYRNRDGGYQPSLDARAQMYILMFGTNDCNPANEWDAALFESDLNAMLDAYREVNPDAMFCLVAPPELYPNAKTGEITMNEELLGGEIREIVARVADEQGAIYVDMFAATQDHPEWYGPDGIHLYDEGYEQIGTVIYEAVAEALK